MKKLVTVFVLGFAALLYACGSNVATENSASTDASAVLDVVSYSFTGVEAGRDNLKDLTATCGEETLDDIMMAYPGCRITGEVTVGEWTAFVDLVVDDNCKLDGKIYIYMGETRYEFDVEDNRTIGEIDGRKVAGKINFRSKAPQCLPHVDIFPVKGQSCDSCDPADDMFCKEDVDSSVVAQYQNIIDRCKVEAGEECYTVNKSDPMCAYALSILKDLIN